MSKRKREIDFHISSIIYQQKMIDEYTKNTARGKKHYKKVDI